MPLCWIASQDITVDGSIEVDDVVTDYTVPEAETVIIDAALVPLWYKTILQLEMQKEVNDSLTASLRIAAGTGKHYAGQLENMKRQNEKLQGIIANLKEQNKAMTGDAESMTRLYLRWRTIGRISIGVATAATLLLLID